MIVRPLALLVLVLLIVTASNAQPAVATTPPPGGSARPALDVGPYRDAAQRIIAAATADSAAWNRLAVLCDTYGHRLSGSASLEAAIDWILAEMTADGLENVRGQPVDVPKWVRGEESATLTSPRVEALAMLGLGGSVATPPEGLTAQVVVVRTFEELTSRADEIAGKIVLFNAPFTNYGETVRYRVAGATAAAQAGAIASLIRSVGPFSMQTPHTGTMRYTEGVRQIPHAALSAEAADLLDRLATRGQRPVVTLKMQAHFEGEARSRNVVAELVGRERPEEVVVLGGHIDSWDVGQGAMDDAGGSVAAWEAVRLLQRLGLRPRRTIRVVLWTNEENGLRGGEAYADSVESRMADHQLAMESDGGVFAPHGFGVGATPEAFALLEPLGALLAPIVARRADGRGAIVEGGGGADIGPLMRAGVPGMGLDTAGERYFWYHHTAADTVDKLDPSEMARCVAAMAIVAYVAAEMPERLPHGAPIQGE